MDFTFLSILVLLVACAIYAIRLHLRQTHVATERDYAKRELDALRAAASQASADLQRERAAHAAAEQKLAAVEAESTARLEAERNRFAEQETRTKQYLADLEKLRASMQTEFQAVAAKLLDEKSKKFSDQNKEQVDTLLHPLRQQIKEFRERVDTVYKGDTEDRAALKTQIEQLRQLNTHITEEASALTRALKGQSQARGAWGELVLERLLDSAGLVKGENYLVQESITTTDGRRLRPDILVRLPDERHLVIDSKVSLIAYERAVNAEDDAAKTAATTEHVRAVRTHVEQLSAKQYDDTGKLVTPDYVFMFVPLDHAFAMAIHADPALYEWAFDRRVILVTAPSLLVALKTVAMVWKQDRQTKNVQAIADRGGALYDKFVGLINDLESIGKELTQAQSAYDAAMNKLSTGRGNLLNQVEDLKRLGAKAKKSLPAADPALDD
ncbi:DNA recombination protein RmuC [Actomonas aquatica]|uniref:DNA recombination protein RmuC n=1 Tax=Actomonas aquatica TaxID=2866162 RepID=A0ABZ1CAT6_9BACT|nr:DNA recombination protein RmuC [Opitutus sp. WL0086]WRQ88783.1 DNA recombination protein RmuC [Opitutus sp. WL0086]